jgi:hypothetical protein
MMTPLEISEYKNRWMRTAERGIAVHSDLEGFAKDWCKQNLKKQEWNQVRYTDVYEHTFYFETPDISDSFRKASATKFKD